jgi:hypothetical protein
MRRPVNTRFFSQPGFEQLYEAYSKVFETDKKGAFVLDPAQALAHTALVRQSVMLEHPMDPQAFSELESIACRYAQEIPQQIDEGVLYA